MRLKIRDWDVHFENAASRKLKRLDWVAIPNRMDGAGYTELVDHPNGAAHLGAWIAIVEMASRQGSTHEERGFLPRPAGTAGDIGGICQCLGRISRIPGRIFAEVLPRLISIGWIENLESANEVAESADEVAAQEGKERRERKKGNTQKVTVSRFDEWILPWPRVADRDSAARNWISRVNDEDIDSVFACRDRYLSSEEVVNRKVVMEPWKFIMQQGDNAWAGKWPPANENGSGGTQWTKT